MRRRSALLLGGVVLVSTAIAARVWIDRSIPSPQPPLPTELTRLDSDVVALIRDKASKVQQAFSSDEAWRELGMVYHGNGFLELAKLCYERVLQLNPGSLKTWYYLALIHDQLGDLDEAIATMTLVAEVAKGYSPVHWRLGYWLLDRNEVDAAEAAFEQAATIEPINPAPQVGLARVYLRRNENQRAAQVLEPLLNDTSSAGFNYQYINQLLSIAWRRLGRFEDADHAAARSQQLRKQHVSWPDMWEQELEPYKADVYAKLHQVQAMIDQAHFEQAERLLVHLRNQYPDNTSILLRLANCHREMKQFHQSIAAIHEAHKAQPDSPAVHLNYALTYFEMSQKATDPQAAAMRALARNHVETALDLNPVLPPAHMLKGDLLLDQGDPEGARQVFTEAATRCGEQAFWLMRIAETHFDSQQWEDAADVSQQVTQLLPLHHEAWYLLGMSQMNLSEMQAAKRALEQASRLKPDDAKVAAALARVAAAGQSKAASPAPTAEPQQ